MCLTTSSERHRRYALHVQRVEVNAYSEYKWIAISIGLTGPDSIHNDSSDI